MKLSKYIPKIIFKSKKSRSISRSENSSFGSVTTSTSSCSRLKIPHGLLSTPTSVLQPEISYSELVQAFHMINVDGKIFGPNPPSEEEMIHLLHEVTACDGELRDVFDFFDTDHDGKITAEELFNVFKCIGDSKCTLEDCKGMISGVDKNGDGFVCFEDFSLMMEQQR